MNSPIERLNTYGIFSSDCIEMHIRDLIDICTERVHLYQLFEAAKTQHIKSGSVEWSSFIRNEIKSRKLKTYDMLLQHDENVGYATAKRNDHIAHWLLSLRYCRTDEQRSDFIKWELEWFTLLYKQMTKIENQEFLRKNNFTYELVTLNEKYSMEDELKHFKGYTNSLLWYKAPFHTISTHLISHRKVILLKGLAYFPENYVICCVRETLIKQFSEQLEWNDRMLTMYELNDERLKYLLEAMPVFRSSNYNSGQFKVNLDNISDVANDHYPLCMQNLHNELMQQHHLKYDSKMQYGIFLKCIGLSYEEAMIFWEREFTKKITANKFKREYSYLFKHQYGKVGGKFNYSPYSCEKILNSSPAYNQCHGCPYKHWDRNKLLKKLCEVNLGGDNVEKIVGFVNRKQYKEACTAYFSARHNVIRDDIILSPNQYALESFKIENKLKTLMGHICDRSLDGEQ